MPSAPRLGQCAPAGPPQPPQHWASLAMEHTAYLLPLCVDAALPAAWKAASFVQVRRGCAPWLRSLGCRPHRRSAAFDARDCHFLLPRCQTPSVVLAASSNAVMVITAGFFIAGGYCIDSSSGYFPFSFASVWIGVGSWQLGLPAGRSALSANPHLSQRHALTRCPVSVAPHSAASCLHSFATPQTFATFPTSEAGP